jgi:hypothetical protein
MVFNDQPATLATGAMIRGCWHFRMGVDVKKTAKFACFTDLIGSNKIYDILSLRSLVRTHSAELWWIPTQKKITKGT